MAAPESDPTKTVLYFGGVVLVGLAIGGIVATSLVPAIGDWVGSYFFSPDVEAEKDPHAKAMGLVARGDFEGAVEEYRAMFKENPEDTLALMEAARLDSEKLGRPQEAAALIE